MFSVKQTMEVKETDDGMALEFNVTSGDSRLKVDGLLGWETLGGLLGGDKAQNKEKLTEMYKKVRASLDQMKTAKIQD